MTKSERIKQSAMQELEEANEVKSQNFASVM